MQDDPSEVGWMMAWAVGRAVRQVGMLGAVAVLSAAPFVAGASALWARGEYVRVRADTDRAAALAMCAARRTAALERAVEARQQAAFVPAVPAFPAVQERAPCGEPDIETVARGRYAISRASVGCLLERPALMRPLMILPEAEGGRVVGVRLLRVNRDGTLYRLGLRSGDVILRVNGWSVAQPDRALRAYARLRRAGRLTVDLRRADKPLALRYYITDGG